MKKIKSTGLIPQLLEKKLGFWNAYIITIAITIIYIARFFCWMPSLLEEFVPIALIYISVALLMLFERRRNK